MYLNVQGGVVRLFVCVFNALQHTVRFVLCCVFENLNGQYFFLNCDQFLYIVSIEISFKSSHTYEMRQTI